MTISFDNFSIDMDAFELCDDGVAVPVEPLVLDLIIEMSRQPGLLRTRDDLIDTVWKGRIVSDTTISTAIKSARRVLGDTGSTQRYIRTVRGRGFQFLGKVSEVAASSDAKQGQLVDIPTLSVRVVTLDDTVSKAVSQALETRLRAVFGRVPFLNIVAPARGDGQAVGPRPTHLIEVALSSIGETLYADTSLSDCASGLQNWARHFSAPESDGVTKLVADVGSKVEPQILRAISDFYVTQDADAPRGLILKAMLVIAERGWNPASIGQASGLLESAIAKDKDQPIAYAILSLLNAIGYRVGMLRHDETIVQRAIENAELALSLENQNSTVLGLAGCALCDVGQLARGEPIIDRSLDLDPMNGHAHAAKGAVQMMRGDFASAVEPLRTSIRISPADSRLAVWGALLAMAELKCGEPSMARESADQAMSRDDCNYLPRLASVAIHLAAGDKLAFKMAVKELHRVHPNITSNEVKYFVGPEAKDIIWPAISALEG